MRVFLTHRGTAPAAVIVTGNEDPEAETCLCRLVDAGPATTLHQHYLYGCAHAAGNLLAH